VAVGCVLHILNLILMNAYHSTFGHEEMGVPSALRTSFIISYLVHKFPEVSTLPPLTQKNRLTFMKSWLYLQSPFRSSLLCAEFLGVERLLRKDRSQGYRVPRRGRLEGALVVCNSRLW
jgi:hypothetical protein